jgi:hypothetical protein
MHLSSQYHSILWNFLLIHSDRDLKSTTVLLHFLSSRENYFSGRVTSIHSKWPRFFTKHWCSKIPVVFALCTKNPLFSEELRVILPDLMKGAAIHTVSAEFLKQISQNKCHGITYFRIKLKYIICLNNVFWDIDPWLGVHLCISYILFSHPLFHKYLLSSYYYTKHDMPTQEKTKSMVTSSRSLCSSIVVGK